MVDLTGGGVDFAFDAIGKVETTEQAVRMLGIGGAAVVVGLPPTGAQARFDPLVLAEREQRIIGSNYGSAIPAEDFPELVSRYLDGELRLDELVSGRRPLAGGRGRAPGPGRRPGAAHAARPVALRAPVGARPPAAAGFGRADMLTRCLGGDYVGGRA